MYTKIAKGEHKPLRPKTVANAKVDNASWPFV